MNSVQWYQNIRQRYVHGLSYSNQHIRCISAEDGLRYFVFIISYILPSLIYSSTFLDAGDSPSTMLNCSQQVERLIVHLGHNSHRNSSD